MSTPSGQDDPPQPPTTSNSQPTTSGPSVPESQGDQGSSRPRPPPLSQQPAQPSQVPLIREELLRTLPTNSRSPSPSSAAFPQYLQDGQRRPSLAGLRQPSIRLRRLPTPGFVGGSLSGLPLPSPDANAYGGAMPPLSQQVTPTGAPAPLPGGRARSASDPPRVRGGGAAVGSSGGGGSGGTADTTGIPLTQMPTLVEEVSDSAHHRVHTVQGLPRAAETSPGQGGLRGGLAGEGISTSQYTPSAVDSAPSKLEDLDLDPNLVDVLDVVDPEISALTSLTNMQNSLFVPNLGRLISRRPIYTLTPSPTRITKAPTRVTPPEPAPSEPSELPPLEAESSEDRPPLTQLSTITSTISTSRYAVLPHGQSLQGWTPDEKSELNDHVRHMLHSRRSKFRRAMKGFGQYVRRPLGFFITVYATLITLFGLAWVLFLIGWINVGGKQLYIINIIDNVLVALFAIMGDGLAPFRAWDTYNSIFIVHYHHKTWKIRKKQALPKLENKNDLPTLREEEVGMEETKEGYYTVLTDKQQASLQKHITRYSNSHTFYKPHETATHYAFPIIFVIIIQTLLDCHSLLQISLGSVTWAISYHHRPFALTTVILCCSITCNITAGVMISVGDHKTRKKDVIERMYRQELTSEAIELVAKKRKGREHNGELDNGGEDSGAGSNEGEKSPSALEKSPKNQALSPVEEHVKQDPVQAESPVISTTGVEPTKQNGKSA